MEKNRYKSRKSLLLITVELTCIQRPGSPFRWSKGVLIFFIVLYQCNRYAAYGVDWSFTSFGTSRGRNTLGPTCRDAWIFCFVTMFIFLDQLKRLDSQRTCNKRSTCFKQQFGHSPRVTANIGLTVFFNVRKESGELK